VSGEIVALEGRTTLMAKANEIAYVAEVARQNVMPLADFQAYLLNKPFSDPRCHEYLMDVAQIMKFFPPAPTRILDVGVGSGWTSEIFARAGYEVTGIDISSDMIDIAKRRSCSARFLVADYETGLIGETFDGVVIYDALHHCDEEYLVIKNIYDALVPNGVLVTIEPGLGHSTASYSLDAVSKFGVTEKDMLYRLQNTHMRRAGFTSIRQHQRSATRGEGIFYSIAETVHLARGVSSVVVVIK
jgi:2-polyprenyl-3-methyl-5-hydroxy-6-metoxy-1,4-benzoquinol methylase